MSEREYIYVPKDVAKQLKQLFSQGYGEQRITPEYTRETLKKLIDNENQGIKNDLECMSDDVQRFKHILAEYQHEYKETLTTHREGVYAIFEQIDAEMPSVLQHATKVATTISNEVAKPLKECLKTINELGCVLNGINEYKLTKMLDIIQQLKGIDEKTANILIQVLTLHVKE